MPREDPFKSPHEEQLEPQVEAVCQAEFEGNLLRRLIYPPTTLEPMDQKPGAQVQTLTISGPPAAVTMLFKMLEAMFHFQSDSPVIDIDGLSDHLRAPDEEPPF